MYGPNTNGVIGYVARAADPIVAYQIGEYFKNNDANNKIFGGSRNGEGSAPHILAHGILGAAVSYATGNNPTTGAISAISSEAAAPILSNYLFNTKDVDKLTTEQKRTVESITSLASMAISSTSGNSSDIGNAQQISQTAVEDNFNVVGHYYTTYVALREGGFNQQYAAEIARAAWAPDTDQRSATSEESLNESLKMPSILRKYHTIRNQPDIHALDGKNAAEAKKMREEKGVEVQKLLDTLKQMQNTGQPVPTLNTAQENLLHVFGDTYAHVQKNGSHFGEGLGHFSFNPLVPDWGAKQDNPANKIITPLYRQYETDLIKMASNNKKTASPEFNQMINEVTNPKFMVPGEKISIPQQIGIIENFNNSKYPGQKIPEPREEQEFNK